MDTATFWIDVRDNNGRLVFSWLEHDIAWDDIGALEEKMKAKYPQYIITVGEQEQEN